MSNSNNECSIECSDVVKIAKDYYDSSHADEFYYHIWGGEDIHIGIYDDPDNGPIPDASRKSVEQMAALVKNLNKDTKLLDVGAGYGGAARYIASTFGCSVTCLNLSEKENERNRYKNEEANLSHLITVKDGDFENLPFDDSSFNVVWSEDAILHSGAKERVFNEIHRVLVKGGEFIFTDPMQSDCCPPDVLRPVLERIHLDAFGSFAVYKEYALNIGFEEVEIIDLSKHLVNHYSRVRAELQGRYDEMVERSGKDYVERMLKGLSHWVEAGQKGYLAWGILHFRKG